jgi:acyl transferase domain-containing protein
MVRSGGTRRASCEDAPAAPIPRGGFEQLFSFTVVVTKFWVYFVSCTGRSGVARYILVARGDSVSALVERAGEHVAGRRPSSQGRLALAVTCESLTDARQKLARAPVLLRDRRPLCGEEGLYFQPAPAGAGGLAFLFPGQGSQYTGMLAGLAGAWEPLATALGELDAAWRALTDASLLARIHRERTPQRDAELADTVTAQPAIGLVSAALARALAKLEVSPSFAAGHSYGELTALWLAGALDTPTFLDLSRARGRLMGAAGDVAPGAMVAVFARRELAAELIDAAPGTLTVANLNAPAKTVLSGDVASVEAVEQACAARGVRALRLKTSCAFHSPLMETVAEDWDEKLASVERAGRLRPPSEVVVVSSVTSASYARAAEVRALLARQLTSPVRWIETCEELYARGVRVFVEVGPGRALTTLAGEIFGDRPHLALASDPGAEDPRDHLAKLAAQLASHGIGGGWEALAPPPEGAAIAGEVAAGNAALTVPLASREGTANEAAAALPGFFVANQRVLEAFFARQGELLESAAKACPVEERAALYASAVAANERLVTEFLSTQADAVAALLGAQPAPRAPALAEAADAALEQAVAAPAADSELSGGLHERVATWLRAHLCELTGFPPEAIQRHTRFEADLGLDSITMISVWTAALEEFPQFEALTSRLGELSSIDAVLDAVGRMDVTDTVGRPREGAEPEETSRQPAGDEGLRRAVIAAIATEASVAVQTIRGEANLEDDLGLDVFSRERMMSTLCAELPGAAVGGRELLNVRTVDELIALLTALSGPDAQPEAPAQGGGQGTGRYVLRPRRFRPRGRAIPEAVLLLGAPGAALARFADELRGSASAVGELRVVDGGFRLGDAYDEFVPFEDSARLAEAIAARGLARATLVALLWPETDALAATGADAWSRSIDRGATGLFALARALVRHAPDGRPAPARELIVIARRRHGAACAGALGVARSLRQEWPGARVRTAVHEADTLGSACELLAALCATEGDDDLWIDARGMARAVLEPAPLSAPALAEPRLSPGATILALGGASGITSVASCALAARYGCHIAAIGRTPPGPEMLADLEDDGEAKRAFLADAGPGEDLAALNRTWQTVVRQRALWRTRRRVEAAGGSFSYHAADATDDGALAAAIEAIRREHGPIRGLLHGAGTTHDGVVADKSIDSFRAVLQAKAKPAFQLRRLLRSEPLAFAFLFSSLSAYVGTPGQTDYAAANEILNAVARQWNEEVDYPVRALLWSVWTESGLASAGLKALMSRHAIEGITDAAGAKMLLDEIRLGRKDEPWVLLSPPSAIRYGAGTTTLAPPGDRPAPPRKAAVGAKVS